MTARVYISTLGPNGEPHGWHKVEVPDPPLPGLRMPIMQPTGLGQLVFRLVAVEHGVAVYL